MYQIQENQIRTGKELFFGFSQPRGKLLTPYKNFLQHVTDKFGLKQKDLLEIINISRQNLYEDGPRESVNQATVSKWLNQNNKYTSHKTIKEIFSENYPNEITSSLGLHWFAIQSTRYQYFFPLFNSIVLTQDNAEKWFIFIKEKLRHKTKYQFLDRDYQKLTIFILEFIEFEMDWEVPKSPRDRFDIKFDSFITNWVHYFTEYLEINNASHKDFPKILGYAISSSIARISDNLVIPKNYLYRGCGLCDIFTIVKKSIPKTEDKALEAAKKLLDRYDNFSNKLLKECNTNLNQRNIKSIRNKKILFKHNNEKPNSNEGIHEINLVAKLEKLNISNKTMQKQILSLEEKLDKLILEIKEFRSRK